MRNLRRSSAPVWPRAGGLMLPRNCTVLGQFLIGCTAIASRRPLARRDDRAYREHLTEEQRSQHRGPQRGGRVASPLHPSNAARRSPRAVSAEPAAGPVIPPSCGNRIEQRLAGRDRSRTVNARRQRPARTRARERFQLRDLLLSSRVNEMFRPVATWLLLCGASAGWSRHNARSRDRW